MSEFYEDTGMCTDQCTSQCDHLNANKSGFKMQEPSAFEKQSLYAGVHDSSFLIEADIRKNADDKLEKNNEPHLLDVTGLTSSAKLYNKYSELPLKNRYLTQIAYLERELSTSK